MAHLVIAQMTDVQAQHPGLELSLSPSDEFVVSGPVGFCVTHDGSTIEDRYDIEIRVHDEYPSWPPSVWEIGGKISDDYGHFMEAGNLCLGAPVEVRRRFAHNPTLFAFINDLVIPYLFTHAYSVEHGEPPYGELNHGTLGLLEYYMDHFGTRIIPTLKLLKCLADNFAPPLASCPCGSGRKLQDCHEPKLDELRPHYWPELFEKELREMIEMARMAEIDLPERDVMPKRMWQKREQRRRRKRKK